MLVVIAVAVVGIVVLGAAAAHVLGSQSQVAGDKSVIARTTSALRSSFTPREANDHDVQHAGDDYVDDNENPLHEEHSNNPLHEEHEDYYTLSDMDIETVGGGGEGSRSSAPNAAFESEEQHGHGGPSKYKLSATGKLGVC